MFSATTVRKIEQIAKTLGVEPAALLAVAEVESAGVTEWNVNGKKLPPIRFEGHYFHRKLKGKKLSRAVAEGLANPTAGAVKNPNSYAARYAMLERARAIDPQAADESTSWGIGQVMGDHWDELGYDSVHEMVEAAMSGVDGQVSIMAKYIKEFGLVDELQSKGWAAFARQYNGKNYRKNRYDEKMATAYAKYRKRGENIEPDEDVGDDTIAQYQKDLKALGYYKGRVDGINGKMTKQAVRAFQKDHGLVADGVYGKMTDEALDAEIAKREGKKGDSSVKTGTGITGTGVIVDVINTQAQKLDAVKDYSHIIGYVVAAMILIGVVLTFYGLWKRFRAQGE